MSSFEDMSEGLEQNVDVDYTGLVMQDMYEILTTQRNPWPAKYTKLKKLEFLDKMLDYLKEEQKYEMCEGIQKMKDRIKNESVTKNKGTRSKRSRRRS